MIEFLFCAAISKELLYHKIIETSRDFGVSESAMMYVVNNEAKKTSTGDFLPCGDGDTNLTDKNGNPHQSRGIVQINKFYHPEVSDVQAYDVNYSLWFLATNLQKGQCKQWTTCRVFMKKYPLADMT